MEIKKGVNIKGIKGEIILGYIIVSEIYREMGKRIVVTSALDGIHKEKSKHYDGHALDFRIWDFNDKELLKLHKKAQLNLGEQFDVVLEKDHLHIEFDPK
jgi:uncharacterized protein YcbK (DUF882 family)